MVFNSTEFAIFFSILFTIYWLSRNFRNVQNLVLLAGSCYFYGQFHYSFPIYLYSLVAVTYLYGILIDKTEDASKRKVIQILAIITISFGLVYLKYSSLIIGGIKGLSQWQASALHLLVPVGISFFTFSSLGYVIDIYRRKIPVERNFITLATYISFVPHLLIGPIPSAKSILPQFKKKPSLTITGIDQSAGEILWGLFKKIVVADNIDLGVKYCFARHHELQGGSLLVGILLFYIELYADFSGYSDMARGFARLLGIDIVRNFNVPFIAKSISEFWRRWHISLFAWFSEYVFSPMVLAFRKLGNAAIPVAIILTFCISGIWHGTDWKFMLFGLMQGIAIVYEDFTKKKKKKIFSVFPRWSTTVVFTILTSLYFTLTLVFFRADSINDSFEIFGKIFSAGLFSAPVTFIAKYLKWCVPLLIIELIQSKGSYTFDIEQWGLSKLLEKLNINKTSISVINIFIKLILYIILCYCIWLFYKKMNMAEYYYFKF